MLQYGMRLQYNNVTVLQCYNVTMLILLLCYFPPFSKCVTKCITLCYTTPNTIGCVECNLPWARLHSQAIPPHHYHCTTPTTNTTTHHLPPLPPTTHPLGVYSIATAVLPTSTPHSCYDQDIISELYSAPHHPPPPHSLTTHCHHHQGRRVYSTTTTQPHHPPPPPSPHQHHLPPHPTHAR